MVYSCFGMLCYLCFSVESLWLRPTAALWSVQPLRPFCFRACFSGLFIQRGSMYGGTHISNTGRGPISTKKFGDGADFFGPRFARENAR
jgi:hypothetical protein